MGTLRNLSFLVLTAAVVLLVLRMCTIRIEPGQTGVVNAEWTTGLVEQDYGPGFHWDVGPMHTWTVFDTTVQTLHMTREKSEYSLGDLHGPLLVKSSDGATVTMDVTIKYQVEPGSVWKVYKLAGAGDRYKDQVRAQSVDVLSPTLGRLRTDEFYNPVKRRETSGQIERDLAERLARIHVKLVAVLIRDLEFEKAFEARIKEKTLAQQDAELNKAKTQAAEFRGRTEKIQAETEAKVTVIHQEKEKTLATMKAENDKRIAALRAEYQKAVTEIKSDADLFAAFQQAEGTKVMKEAEAKGQTLKREALAVDGGSTLVGLELVRNLKFGSLTVSTQQVNPLDVESLLRLFGVK
jgi:regulator of protease activity HflC (stomatin/prohibitin superfamily)